MRFVRNKVYEYHVRVEKKAEIADFSTFFVKILSALAYVHIFSYLCAQIALMSKWQRFDFGKEFVEVKSER